MTAHLCRCGDTLDADVQRSGAVLSAAVATGLLCGVAFVHRERRVNSQWRAATARYRERYRPGATREQVEADLKRLGVTWHQFSGGSYANDENPFQDVVSIGSRPDRLCGTTVYASLVIVFRRNLHATVLTDEPEDAVSRVYLQEVDDCAVI